MNYWEEYYKAEGLEDALKAKFQDESL